MFKIMHYRKFYEKLTNKKIPKDFEVHHIDFDRENNDIHNLIAIPRDLHRKYHSSFKQCEYYEIKTPKFFTVIGYDHDLYSYMIELHKEHDLLRLKFKHWIHFRNHLLGYHNDIINTNYKY